ncbi:MAG: ferredoxin [Myxococcota bacterium]
MSRAKFEVDEDHCIGCGLCEERAPENMEVPATLMHARVAKQPTTAEEEEACVEAAEYCPTMGLRRVANAEPAAARRPDESSLTELSSL